MKKPKLNFSISDLYAYIPLFFSLKFPKGTPQREHAIAHVTLFIKWLEDNIK